MSGYVAIILLVVGVLTITLSLISEDNKAAPYVFLIGVVFLFASIIAGLFWYSDVQYAQRVARCLQVFPNYTRPMCEFLSEIRSR